MSSTDQYLDLMRDLDRGENMFGPLQDDIRARLFAVADNPNDETWNAAYSILVGKDDGWPITLWQALLKFTDFNLTTGPSHEIGKGRTSTWAEVPTREQILDAIAAVVR